MFKFLLEVICCRIYPNCDRKYISGLHVTLSHAMETSNGFCFEQALLIASFPEANNIVEAHRWRLAEKKRSNLSVGCTEQIYQ